ncbi:hypothetical protein HPB51_007093 [Rhipicephalus microplus]|uniref:Uncharacterized protein n=1 Tax=Rhipicephalus microplus TaxID=6941 RepID=A0A9J6DZ61_RHIMP|nr:hypothetical protein HPB51_007093 [Rhipicephalus microplus]
MACLRASRQVMPSTWQKEPRPVTYCSKPRHRSCTQEWPADQAHRVPHLPPVHVPGQRDLRQPRACCPNLRSRPQERYFKAPGMKDEKLPTEKAPSNKKADSTAAILGTPAILQNWSPCQETEIQASSSNEDGYPEKTECELSLSPQKSDAASSDSSAITETSSPTSSSSWSHNTPAPCPNTSVEEGSPEQKELGSSSPLVTDDTGTPGKAALTTPQAEGEKQVFLSVPTTPLSRPSTQLYRYVNKSSASQETQPRPLARNSYVLGPPEEPFPSLPSIGAPNNTKLCEAQVPTTNTRQKSQEVQKPAVSTQKCTPPSQLPASPGSTSQLETVLYRPIARKNSFRSATQEAISAHLAAVEGAHRVQINYGRNVIADVVATGAPLAPLLAVSDICEISVRARQASTNTCSGVIHNIDPVATEEELRDNIASQLPVLQCTRSGRNVVIMHDSLERLLARARFEQRLEGGAQFQFWARLQQVGGGAVSDVTVLEEEEEEEEAETL